jgi:hypothetical protein
MKLDRLAADVVRSFATPEPIVRIIGLHPEIFEVMSREERVVQTEEFFRDVNDVIARTRASNGTSFLCECEPLLQRHFRNERPRPPLHSTPGDYVVPAGHDIPDLEEVVQSQNGYAIVRKRAADH